MLTVNVWKDELDSKPFGISFEARQLELTAESLADLIHELQACLDDSEESFFKQINIGVELDNGEAVEEDLYEESD